MKHLYGCLTSTASKELQLAITFTTQWHLLSNSFNALNVCVLMPASKHSHEIHKHNDPHLQ